MKVPLFEVLNKVCRVLIIRLLWESPEMASFTFNERGEVVGTGEPGLRVFFNVVNFIPNGDGPGTSFLSLFSLQTDRC